jgi:DNA-binding response OmpR family regulator
MSKHILVIDDEEIIRTSFILALEDTGYRVDTADSGMKAIDYLTSNKYGLIFLDLKMPGLNGVETLLKLRKIDDKVPICIVTAFYKEFFSELKIAQEKGIKFELAKKPLNSNEIILITKSVLDEPQLY